ncbi:MAG: hypothetical protein ACJ79N_10925 [Gemmatimonadaceae bacterium]
MPADGSPRKRARRGFVFGELLVALLLLAVAVSSLAALMYSVSRRPEARAEAECVAADAARGKCVPARPASDGASKLLRSGCETRSGAARRACKDTLTSADSSNPTIVKARTDSTAMALLARKQTERTVVRPDRGFHR